jgi:hypothetical protein
MIMRRSALLALLVLAATTAAMLVRSGTHDAPAAQVRSEPRRIAAPALAPAQRAQVEEEPAPVPPKLADKAELDAFLAEILRTAKERGEVRKDDRRLGAAAIHALDDQLDRGVEAAYALLRKKRGFLQGLSTRAGDLGLVSQLQADAAVLFEGVDNALKLLGDQYLARLYRVVSERFHLPQWDAAIERKLRVLDGIYEKMASRAASRRFEVLEIVIIVLIAISTVMPLLPTLFP